MSNTRERLKPNGTKVRSLATEANDLVDELETLLINAIALADSGRVRVDIANSLELSKKLRQTLSEIVTISGYKK